MQTTRERRAPRWRGTAGSASSRATSSPSTGSASSPRWTGPLLVLGNPPWVTSAQLGALGSGNAPRKENRGGLRGLDAMTGKSNFDVSEWMHRAPPRGARRTRRDDRARCASRRWRGGSSRPSPRAISPWRRSGSWRVDAARHFDASVSAVLFVAETRRPRGREAAAFAVSAGSRRASDRVADGRARGEARDRRSASSTACSSPTPDRYARTRHLAGTCTPEWRSGVKHDCARVMELVRTSAPRAWRNGLGEIVDVEDELVHPLLKSSDIANARRRPSRAMIVTQRALGEDTAALRRARAARLEIPDPPSRAASTHARARSTRSSRRSRCSASAATRSRRGRWRSPGLYKRSTFTVVGPHEGRPVVLDDTCYFLAFDDEARARRAADALRSEAATDFFGVAHLLGREAADHQGHPAGARSASAATLNGTSRRPCSFGHDPAHAGLPRALRRAAGQLRVGATVA